MLRDEFIDVFDGLLDLRPGLQFRVLQGMKLAFELLDLFPAIAQFAFGQAYNLAQALIVRHQALHLAPDFGQAFAKALNALLQNLPVVTALHVMY